MLVKSLNHRDYSMNLLNGYNLFSVLVIFTSTFQFLCKFTSQKNNHKLNKSALIYFLTKRLVKHRSQQYIVFSREKSIQLLEKLSLLSKFFQFYERFVRNRIILKINDAQEFTNLSKSISVLFELSFLSKLSIF